jgi:hypothetical protein
MKLIFGMVPYFDPTRRNVKREKYGSPDPPPPPCNVFPSISKYYCQIFTNQRACAHAA